MLRYNVFLHKDHISSLAALNIDGWYKGLQLIPWANFERHWEVDSPLFFNKDQNDLRTPSVNSKCQLLLENCAMYWQQKVFCCMKCSNFDEDSQFSSHEKICNSLGHFFVNSKVCVNWRIRSSFLLAQDHDWPKYFTTY